MKNLPWMVFLIIFPAASSWAESSYPWLSNPVGVENEIAARIALPASFRRIDYPPDSFAAWLRSLPLKKGSPPVFLYNGRKKTNQSAHFAVINIDTGKRDLQQCADAVMRLRAEYLYAQGEYDRIGFHFTNGTKADFSHWAKGFRPVIKKNRVKWKQKGKKGYGRKNFRKYLETVFCYAGTASLEKEMKQVPVSKMRSGDVFIQGGFPGHAVLVADMAQDPSGRRIFLLLQSYMPAQDIHLLKNPRPLKGLPPGQPWYYTEFSVLETPEWRFERGDLHRFSGAGS